MGQEYTLSYSAEQIDEKLGKMDNVVLLTEQSLTEEQQAQVRENIGSAGIFIGSGDMPDNCDVQIDPNGEPISGAFLLYSEQNLTDEQKTQARVNLGISDEYMNSLIDTKLGVIENGTY